MSMTQIRGIPTYIRHPGTAYGGSWVECYHHDCHERATGTYRSHSGAHHYACTDHSGDCHPHCHSPENGDSPGG